MRLRLRGMVAAALPVLLLGCEAGEEPQRQPAGAPLAAAIVPGANLLIEADLQAVRQAPIFAVLLPMFEDEDEGDGAEAAEPGDAASAASGEEGAPHEESSFDEERFFEATGLRAADFISLVVSARLDPVELSAAGAGDGGEAEGEGGAPFDPEAFFAAAERAPSAVSLLLAKPLDLDRLERGLREQAVEPAVERVSRVEVAGTPALRAASSKPGEPDTWAAILGGNTVFVAFNQLSLEGALQRAKSGQLAEAAPEIQQARSALPRTAQGSLVFVAPEALRDLIRGRIDEAAEDPGAAAMLGFVRPFEKIRSIGIGVEADAELRVATSYDLGDAAVASQAQAMFGGMLLPMAQAGLAQAAGRSPGEMADRLSITSLGPTLSLVYRMTAEDAAGFEEMRRKKAAEEAAAAEESEAGSEDGAETEDPGA